MYAFQNNILSIPARLLYSDWKVMSYNTYKSYSQRGKLQVTQAGKGQGNEAWVSFESLPVVKGVNIQEFCVRMLGKPEDAHIVTNVLEEYIVPDPEAINFFAEHRKPNGKSLPLSQQREKATSAMILGAIETLLKSRPLTAKAFGKRKTQIWQNISEAVNALNPEKWSFSLPNNPRSLQRKYNQFLTERYATFIHKGEGSDNAKIVTPTMERLFISICCMPNKPYISSVYDIYKQFLYGEIELFDRATGELFNVDDFCDENGNLLEVSESTVKLWLSKAENQLIIAKARNGEYDFSHKLRPHVHRHAPLYSMSKITLDDRDIMHTKLPDGTKVMAYYAYDVMSTALIGIAHSKKKDTELFLDCFRSMFQFTTSYGLGTPMQIEVERHLTGEFADGLLKANNLFPFVRFCNPTNSQEKYAETMIRGKKYGIEKDRHQNVGRHYARRDSNRTTQQKIFDEFNNNYKEAKASYDDIVAMELQEQTLYNNQPHPDQQRFPGKTRLEVFLENVNPNLPQLNRALLAQYIGKCTTTTIRRSQYVTVQYQKYQLPNPQVLTLLAPNNYQVEAYYLPNKDGITEVYLYQNGAFLCTCSPVPTFNRANAEWTQHDEQQYAEAMSYVTQFDQMVRTQSVQKLNRLGSLTAPIPTATEVDYTPVDYTETPALNYQEYSKTKVETINKALLDL